MDRLSNFLQSCKIAEKFMDTSSDFHKNLTNSVELSTLSLCIDQSSKENSCKPIILLNPCSPPNLEKNINNPGQRLTRCLLRILLNVPANKLHGMEDQALQIFLAAFLFCSVYSMPCQKTRKSFKNKFSIRLEINSPGMFCF